MTTASSGFLVKPSTRAFSPVSLLKAPTAIFYERIQMLILMRHTDEEIMIGDNVRIKVTGIHGSLVYLGITAPKEIKIFRKEIYDKIKNRETKACI